MNVDTIKRAVAEAALDYIESGSIIGVGSGSTSNHFIDLLGEKRIDLEGAVASSESTARRLRELRIPVLELNTTGDLDLYVDGADESNRHLQLIKGGGGALTREKVIASASARFICIADRSKYVDILGAFPLPVEVIPMARSYVGRQLTRLGGNPALREDYRTDNGNIILDVHNLQIAEPIKMERAINNIAGVVSVGLFAQRPADILLLGDESGVQTLARTLHPTDGER